MKIKKDTTIGEIIEKRPDLVQTLHKKGMGCVGCPMAMIETIGQGAEAHGIDTQELLDELNSSESFKKQ